VHRLPPGRRVRLPHHHDPTKYFEALSTTTAFLLKYFTVDTAAKKVIVNQASFKSAAMISGHPTFDAVNNAGMIALKKFFDLTDARLTANQCDPPRLKD